MSRRLRRRLAGWLVLAGAAVALVSCAAPQVRVADARLGRIDLDSLTVDFTLDVANPNDFALPVAAVDWSLALFGQRVGTGTARPDETIPAQASARVPMPVRVSFEQAAGVGRRLLSGGTIPWDLTATLRFDSPAGPLAVDVSDAGTWNNPLR